MRIEVRYYSKNGGTAFFSYLYGAIHFYRQRLIDNEKKIKELEAKIAELEKK